MDVNRFLNVSAPGMLDEDEIVCRAIAYAAAGWDVYCCTTLVGLSDRSDEYNEPHWVIQAVEAQGWRLDRLDYVTVDLDRTYQMLGGVHRPLIRIEAKLMFRRSPTPPGNTQDVHDQ